MEFRRHWRRFWCCYLLGSIIFLAVFLPVFFLIIIPAIAQRIVDNSKLQVHSASVLDPKPDTVTFTVDTSLDIPLALKVQTRPFNASLFNQDEKPIEPYFNVALPTFDLKGGTNMISLTQHDNKILNLHQFVNTLTTAVYQERFVISVKGSTVGHIGALKAPLTLEKNVELTGLDKFSGISVPSAYLISKQSDGTNFKATAVLPNRSVFTIAMGNVTVNIQSADLIIGQATTYDVFLKPGNNTVNVSGWIDLGTVVENLSEILSTQTKALEEGDIEITVTGNSTIYNGHHIGYYEEILNNLTLTTRVPFMNVLVDSIHGMMHSNSDSYSSTASV